MLEGLLSGQKLVLIVEDDTATAELLSKFLETQGFRTRIAPDGSTGLELTRKLRPALVLLDVMMPGMAGYDVLLLIKSDPELKAIPVVMCTALNEIKDVEKCCNYGAEGYIVKPFDLKRVLEKVQSTLEKSGPQSA